MSDLICSKPPREVNKPVPKQSLALVLLQLIGIIALFGSLFWALAAFTAWPDPNLDKPYWNGQYLPGSYKLNDFLASEGLDLSKSLPLGFSPADNLESEKPAFNLLGTNGTTVRLSLQWRGNGYVVDVPASDVTIRLDAANTIRVNMVSNKETTQHKRRFVAVRHSSTFTNIFFFHHWSKKVEYTPITSTETWKRMQHLGVGEFFWKNRGLIRSITITLTPQAYEQYATRLPLNS